LNKQINLKSVRFFPHWDETSILQVTGFLHLVNYVINSQPIINNWVEIGSNLGESSTLLFGFTQIKKIHIIEQSEYSCKLLNKKFENKINDNKCIIYNNFSKKILPSFLDNSIDCIYIDGNHDYDEVKIDIELSIKKLTVNGFLCGHDYNKSWPGVIDAVNFFISTSKYNQKDLILFEDSSWLIRKK